MSDVIPVHLATSDSDLRRIYRLRYSVYVEEMSKPYPTADHQRHELCEEVDAESMHYFATDAQGVLVAAVRAFHGPATRAIVEMFDSSDYPLHVGQLFHYVSRFIVVSSARDLRIASALAKAAYAHARVLGVTVSYLHCNPRLVVLWSRFGYQAYREFIVDPTVGCQVPMLLMAADETRLAEVRSPFLSLAQAFREGDRQWCGAIASQFTDAGLVATLTGSARNCGAKEYR